MTAPRAGGLWNKTKITNADIDSTGATSGYVPKAQGDGTTLWQPDLSGVAAGSITNSDLDSTGIANGKTLKANGSNGVVWANDLTGASPGAITAENLSQGLLDRLSESAVTVLDGSSTGYWTSPDAAAFDVTGTIDLRVKCQPTVWNLTGGQSLIAKWSKTSPSNQLSYRFLLDATGHCQFTFSTAGASSINATSTKTVGSQVTSGVPVWLRCVADPTGGASSHALATFYWSADGSTWNLIDAVSASAAGPWFSGSARVLIGNDDSSAGNRSFFAGNIYKAEIRDGGGSLIEDFNADALAIGQTTITGTNGNVWTAGATATVILVSGSQATVFSLLDTYDARTYGQVSDLRRPANCATTSGSAVLTGTFLATDQEAGKLVCVTGGGAILLNQSNGALALSPAKDKNLLTGSGFTRAMVGRRIQVAGAGTAGATLVTSVWGVESSTKLRMKNNAVTAVSGANYIISEDLYATATASDATTCTLDTNAGITASGLTVWLGTDDAPAIQGAVTAAEAATGSGNGYVILLHGASALGSKILLTKPGHLQGIGHPGYSRALALGVTRLMVMKPNIGAVACSSSNAEMGVTAAMTSGNGVLTDPNGGFVVGDEGKPIYVMGAATQFGSDTQDFLITTIANYTSATQVTLTANAGTTVTEAVYSYGAGAGLVFAGPTLSHLHIVGTAAAKYGLHIMDAGGYTLDRVTISDFTGGVAFFSDRASGFNASCAFIDCNWTDSYQHFIAWGSGGAFTGFNNIDGRSNQVGIFPPQSVTGIRLNNAGMTSAPEFNIQACGTWGIMDGSGNRNMSGCRLEACPYGVVLGSDGVNGNKGTRFRFKSWSNTSLSNAAANKGFTLPVGYPPGNVIDTGFYLPTDVTMRNGDATALASTQWIDPNLILNTAGTGSPEGVVVAPVGSTYNRVDGGGGTCFYVKESGAGNVGWVAK